MVTFEKRKADFLAKSDKSSIGSWDKRIVKLCEKLNASEDYFSLSSCSGRIVLVRNIAEKIANAFVFRSHEKVSAKELDMVLKDYGGKEGLVFKQEPCIIHVACRDLESAKKLLRLGQESGWKNSGIIAISNNRIVVDLRSTEAISFPIFEKGKILLVEGGLNFIIDEANNRLERTWKKIKKLENLV